MCGIAGLFDFNQSSSLTEVHRMTDALQHRGPDGSGYEFIQTPSCQIGIGQRRLSIIDLSETGKQPMQYGHLWISFNGEIYNYKEIKAELQTLGHRFVGHSDTEVILHAFEQWGISGVQKFTGMFAFMIYDTQKEECYCVRDRAGVKPFFYYWKNGLFLFASELKSFHQHSGFKKELNLDAVAAFMQFGNVPNPHCIFNDCFKLSPGHYLHFTLSSPHPVEHKYWDVYDAYNKPKLDLSFKEAKTETESILKKAFDYRMVSDVPVGVFLSGGYDSACLTALLQKDRTEKLKTFTISVPDIGLNEAPFAKELAKHLGTDHHEFSCTQNEALEHLVDIAYYYDEPFADSSALPTSLVCKMAQQQVSVALSADGGDEVFAGYNRYDYLMKHGKYLNQIPPFMRKGLAGIMTKIPSHKIPVASKKYNFHNRYEKLKNLLHNPSAKNMMLSLSKQFPDSQLRSLFKNSFQDLETLYTSDRLSLETYSPLAYMMAVDYQTYLVDDILQKVDRASMRWSLEAREPFLDHSIIEWAAQLPDEYKYFKGIKKHIIKEITHQYIPKALMHRPKMGFAIPIEKWMTHDLKEQIRFYLSDERIIDQGIFDNMLVQELCSDFFSGKKELSLKVWYLFMFQLWHEKWMK